jgi:hypothetical protein
MVCFIWLLLSDSESGPKADTYEHNSEPSVSTENEENLFTKSVKNKSNELCN